MQNKNLFWYLKNTFPITLFFYIFRKSKYYYFKIQIKKTPPIFLLLNACQIFFFYSRYYLKVKKSKIKK